MFPLSLLGVNRNPAGANAGCPLQQTTEPPDPSYAWSRATSKVAAIIPSPPRKTLVTALLAASMDPVAALIWKAAGQEMPGISYVLFNAFPNYLCAALAPLISHIITGLGREVRRAREMGSYVLGERIGAGGVGEVWQATHRFLPAGRHQTDQARRAGGDDEGAGRRVGTAVQA